MSIYQRKLTKEQAQKAANWFIQHRDHILRITETVRYVYPPTNSEDCNNPNLWKAAHWAWFLHEHPEEVL